MNAPYRTIVADPPWKTSTGPMSAGGMGEGFRGGSRQSQPLAYPTMSVAEISALPVASLAADDCHLYLWTTSRYLPDAFAVMAAWGFKYSSTITWTKALIGGGLGGTWRLNVEFVLFGYRGKVDAPRDEAGRAKVVRGSHFAWKRPYDERGKPKHSAKPDEFYGLVESVGHGPRLEMFARAQRAGWSVWGNEVVSDLAIGEARLMPVPSDLQVLVGRAYRAGHRQASQQAGVRPASSGIYRSDDQALAYAKRVAKENR